MGLGKTIQVIAYLAGLHHSGLWRPSLVVAPATVLRQWMGELRTWYPPLRVMLLHDSGRCPYGTPRPDKNGIVAAALDAGDCSVLLTTYEQLRLNRELLLPVRWGVAVLDEGHKIRNPDAEVTLASKQLQTVHRIIMSGSPIQNRLSELWSLFDFIFPGKLGTLPVFTTQFAVPITIGGYTNASKLQVQTAYRCAVVLRDLISPYLLRRRKADVATQLPKKTETVLFCSLTEPQRDLYRAYIHSTDVAEILSNRRKALAGIDVLRKICNHPDLLERAAAQANADYGEPSRSGKLQVLVKVLEAWHKKGHKVLLFTQTQQMLDILEKHALAEGYSYHRMDGNTPIVQRGRLMDDFNTNPDRFLFLLTTKVGGLGVNLTGANMVLIYDPDWNPSTDSQARERAWRIGQSRPVTIYRLITSGTIEEKVYHRQIYKSFLTNKVLQDPRQRRFFAAKDISDLFTLGDEYGGGARGTTTAAARSAGAGHAAAQYGPAAAAAAADATTASGGAADDEASVLRDLFEGTGIKSLIDHSSIEGANNAEAGSNADDAFAAKVAAEAAEVLRQSRLACQTAAVHVPTWTGRHGAAGMAAAAAAAAGRHGTAGSSRGAVAAGGGGSRSSPAAPSGSGGAARGRFGLIGAGAAGPFAGVQAGAAGAGAAPSSAALLARMRERQAAAAAAAGRGSARRGRDSADAAARMAGQVVQFIQAAGGCAHSDLLLSHFREVLREADMPLFKQQLRQVARLAPAPAAAAAGGGGGRGARQGTAAGAGKVWVLREGGQ
ncbi:P-loop containing nucleoside triphosphate hydrolase protein [Scenedesmus sp. NREL 46B-D3]|nr:P-loop containing nucleoside triphosphate hydrolase protein [Scenedesmus sp. NREL 46B-D3]